MEAASKIWNAPTLSVWLSFAEHPQICPQVQLEILSKNPLRFQFPFPIISAIVPVVQFSLFRGSRVVLACFVVSHCGIAKSRIISFKVVFSAESRARNHFSTTASMSAPTRMARRPKQSFANKVSPACMSAFSITLCLSLKIFKFVSCTGQSTSATALKI